jgi:hypothetical protein
LSFCGHEGIKPFEIAINTHQAPAIGDRQGRLMGIGAFSAAWCSQ